MNTSTTHRCLYRGCATPPTMVIVSDVGLEGSLDLYFCDEHAALFKSGQTDEFDIERTESDGNDQPET